LVAFGRIRPAEAGFCLFASARSQRLHSYQIFAIAQNQQAVGPELDGLGGLGGRRRGQSNGQGQATVPTHNTVRPTGDMFVPNPQPSTLIFSLPNGMFIQVNAELIGAEAAGTEGGLWLVGCLPLSDENALAEIDADPQAAVILVVIRDELNGVVFG